MFLCKILDKQNQKITNELNIISTDWNLWNYCCCCFVTLWKAFGFWLPAVNIFALTLALQTEGFNYHLCPSSGSCLCQTAFKRGQCLFSRSCRLLNIINTTDTFVPIQDLPSAWKEIFLGYFIYFSFHKILLWYTLPATEVQNRNTSSFHYPLLTRIWDGGRSCWSLSHLSQQSSCEEKGFLWQA